MCKLSDFKLVKLHLDKHINNTLSNKHWYYFTYLDKVAGIVTSWLSHNDKEFKLRILPISLGIYLIEFPPRYKTSNLKKDTCTVIALIIYLLKSKTYCFRLAMFFGISLRPFPPISKVFKNTIWHKTGGKTLNIFPPKFKTCSFSLQMCLMCVK